MRLLVVDGEAVSREKMVGLLWEYGDCDTAHTGEEAVEMIQQAVRDEKPYQVVTMDVNLPGMSGQETVHAIREWEKAESLAGLRIIMVTSATDLASVSTSMRAGCDAYLMKPFTAESIRETMDQLGESHKLKLKARPPPPPPA